MSEPTDAEIKARQAEYSRRYRQTPEGKAAYAAAAERRAARAEAEVEEVVVRVPKWVAKIRARGF